MQEKINQLEAKLKADDSLAEAMFRKETPEEVQTVLKEAGLEFSLEEIVQLRESIVAAQAEGSEEELSDDDLENVAGGATTYPVPNILVMMSRGMRAKPW